MKKMWSILLILACFALVYSVPVFADRANTSATRSGMESNQRIMDNSMNANNYRVNAADDNDMDWGWLGLLGLAGLFGLRSRDRERT